MQRARRKNPQLRRQRKKRKRRRLHRKPRRRPLLNRRNPPRPRLRQPLLPRPPRARPQQSRQTRRLPQYAAPAAPIIQKCARACRRAAHRRCNVWRKTSRRSHQAVSRPSTPAAAAPRRQQVELQPPRRPVRRPQQRRHLPRRSCCGRCGRVKNCSCCGRLAAAMFARSAEE